MYVKSEDYSKNEHKKKTFEFIVSINVGSILLNNIK